MPPRPRGACPVCHNSSVCLRADGTVGAHRRRYAKGYNADYECRGVGKPPRPPEFMPRELLVEMLAPKAHDGWMAGNLAAGVTSRVAGWGEEFMVPYPKLSERAKDIDRAAVNLVLDGLAELGVDLNQLVGMDQIQDPAEPVGFELIEPSPSDVTVEIDNDRVVVSRFGHPDLVNPTAADLTAAGVPAAPVYGALVAPALADPGPVFEAEPDAPRI